jgi:hypothetical protein
MALSVSENRRKRRAPTNLTKRVFWPSPSRYIGIR